MNIVRNHIDYLVSNLCSYELIKEFTSEEFNQEITAFRIGEIFENYSKQFITEVVVTASYDFNAYGRARTSSIKVALLSDQNQGKEMYNFGSAYEKITLKYDWYTGTIKATLKDTKIYFKVYVLKFYN